MLDLTETLIEKNINLFYIFVGIVFANLPSLIAGKRFIKLVEWLNILGILIIIVNASIILKYHYDKNKELTENYNMVDNKDVINDVKKIIDNWSNNKNTSYPFGNKYNLTITAVRQNLYKNNIIIKDYIDQKTKNTDTNSKNQTLLMAWNDISANFINSIIKMLMTTFKIPVNEEYITEYKDLFMSKVEKSKTKDIFKQEFLNTEIRTAIYNDSRYKSILDSNGFTSDWL
jgi:hypothetical protein